MSPRPVLVVEDDADLSDSLEAVLSSEGYAVKTAANGQEALDWLRVAPSDDLPRCIILDLMMPVMDGAALLRVLRSELPRAEVIPVLVSTATRDPASVLAGLPPPAEIMRKPVDLDELLRKVAHHCGGP